MAAIVVIGQPFRAPTRMPRVMYRESAIAMTTTGDDHDEDQDRHRPPLWPPRRVLGGDLQRHRLGVRAREDQGDQELVPGEDQDDQERRDEARNGDRKHDRAHDPVDRRAVDGRRLLELARQRREVLPHQPDDDRQVGRDVRDDQRDEAVEQADLLEEHVQRNRDRDRRQDPLRDQPERDVAVGQRALEPTADRLGEQHEERDGCRDRDGQRCAKGGGDEGERDRPDADADQPDLRPVGESDKGIGGERAHDQRDQRAGQADDHGVDVGPERVVAELHEDVAPRVERRLEVDERNVERALVDVGGRLERGHDEPIDREQDDGGPAEQEQEGRELGRRGKVGRRLAPERVAHTSSVTRRRTTLTYTVATTVTSSSNK